MPRFFRTLFFLLLLTRVYAGAASPLEHARQAQALLGAGAWSRVICVENRTAHGVYPRTVYALVFEFGGLLWFYTDTNGTQSFSLHADALAAEKADFTPLLRDIDRGFVTYEVLPVEAKTEPATAGRPEPLPNDCFVESIAALNRCVARGEMILRARLLSFQGTMRRSRLSHTVLSYETPSGAFVLDPLGSEGPLRVGRRLVDDPVAVARASRPDIDVQRARWVPTTMPRAAAAVAETRQKSGGGKSS